MLQYDFQLSMSHHIKKPMERDVVAILPNWQGEDVIVPKTDFCRPKCV